MAKLISQKTFEQEIEQLVKDIRRETVPFIDDSTAKKDARVKRALADPFFFAASYFPHYIQLRNGFEKDCWKDPDAKIDWVKMGFAECHSDFFKLCELRNKFIMLAGYSESAKDTLIAKIDVIKKCITKEIFYHILVASTESRAISKLLPLRLEFEHNQRLKTDFGDFLSGNDKNEGGEFILNNGVKLHGMGRDQTMRGAENSGHRPDWIILNDIWDPLREENPGIISKTVDIIKQDYLKRVNTPRWGAMLLFNYVSKQSPEHELVISHEKLGYELHVFRALKFNAKKTEEEREIAHQCKIKKFPDSERSDWEFRHPTIRLNEERKADQDTFDAERMMRPRDKKNAKFKDEDFKYYAVEILKRVEIIHYTFVDPSVKIAADYKGIITLGVPKQDYFEALLIDAWIRQESIDDMLEETFRHYREYKSKVVGVEGIGFAMLLEREYLRMMMKYGPMPLVMVEKVQNKQAKIESDGPDIRSGRVKFILGLSQGNQALVVRQYKGFPDQTPVAKGGIGDEGPDALHECKRLIQTYPPNSTGTGYQSGQKREAHFSSGAY